MHSDAVFCYDPLCENVIWSSPQAATATTAASGGNRESLLGQRPARRKCFLKHEADAGCRNSGVALRSNDGEGEAVSHKRKGSRLSKDEIP